MAVGFVIEKMFGSMVEILMNIILTIDLITNYYEMLSQFITPKKTELPFLFEKGFFYILVNKFVLLEPNVRELGDTNNRSKPYKCLTSNSILCVVHF